VPLFSLARLTAECVRSLFRQALNEKGSQMSRPHAPSKTVLSDPPPLSPRTPCWVDVEELLNRLAKTRATIPTALAPTMTIAVYERGRRLRLESEVGSSWLEVEYIRECWDTFERLGRIRRQDVLEPGRCSAFMFALFRQVPGVVEQVGDDCYLALPA
jgi:hypothetical protein